jgi:hypothetical protein
MKAKGASLGMLQRVQVTFTAASSTFLSLTPDSAYATNSACDVAAVSLHLVKLNRGTRRSQ